MNRSGQTVAVVLAAGRGTRMRSDLPKVLHEVAGRPLLAWVLDAARAGGCDRCVVVVGHGAERVRQAFDAPELEWVVQKEQLGTGHALAQAETVVSPEDLLLVLSGDVPLVGVDTLASLRRAAEGGWGAMAIADLPEPGRLGRVVSRAGRLVKIVEAADATSDELAITTINAGIYALPAGETFDALRGLGTDNAQGELYLTDAVTDRATAGREVSLVELADPREGLGVNTRSQLAEIDGILMERQRRRLQENGVTLIAPGSVRVEAGVEVGRDTILHPNVTLLGRTEIGGGCVVHTGAWIRDTRLDAGVEVHPYTVLDGARVGEGCQVGPFARLRPGAELERAAKVGNFVEIKKSRLGEGAKASHLTYVGDADVGPGANLGAGVVTCNYDGVSKHRTEIGAGAFVGSDTMLVAPVRVGEGATTGAGSVVTKDVPDGALAVGRARQRNIDDWNNRPRPPRSERGGEEE